MSILLHDFKQLTECISEVERIEARVNDSNNSKKGIELAKKEEEKEEVPLLPGMVFL